MYENNNHVFDNIDMIHCLFIVDKADCRASSISSISVNYNGQWILHGMKYTFGIAGAISAIPHERLHHLGLPDRNFVNENGPYDIMNNRFRMPDLRALYGQHPITSRDKCKFNWINPNEILVIDKDNYNTFNNIKLADVNFPQRI